MGYNGWVLKIYRRNYSNIWTRIGHTPFITLHHTIYAISKKVPFPGIPCTLHHPIYQPYAVRILVPQPRNLLRTLVFSGVFALYVTLHNLLCNISCNKYFYRYEKNPAVLRVNGRNWHFFGNALRGPISFRTSCSSRQPHRPT